MNHNKTLKPMSGVIGRGGKLSMTARFRANVELMYSTPPKIKKHPGGNYLGNQIVLLLLVAATSFLFPHVSYAEKKLIVGLTLPEHLPAMKLVNGIYEKFKDNVNNKANGEIKVELQYGSMLGNADSRLRQVRANIIQMSDPAIGNLAPLYADIQIFSLPYLFKDMDTAWKILDGPIGYKVANAIREKLGIRVLGWFVTGDFAHYSSNRPIEKAADLSGMKLRVLSPINAIAVEVHNGSPLPIAFNELYTALRIGAADGADLNMWIIDALKFHEVQKYLFLDKHRLPFGAMVINEAYYDALPSQLQDIISEAAKDGITYNRSKIKNLEPKLLKKLDRAGMIITRPSPEQREALAKPALSASIQYLRHKMTDPTLIDELVSAAHVTPP